MDVNGETLYATRIPSFKNDQCQVWLNLAEVFIHLSFVVWLNLKIQILIVAWYFVFFISLYSYMNQTFVVHFSDNSVFSLKLTGCHSYTCSAIQYNLNLTY